MTDNIKSSIKEIKDENKILQRQLRDLKNDQENLKDELSDLTSSNLYKSWQILNDVKKIFVKPISYHMDKIVIYLMNSNKLELAIKLYGYQQQLKKYLNFNIKLHDFDNEPKIYQISNIKKYCLNNNLFYQIIYPEQKNKVYKPIYVEKANRKTKDVRQPEMYVAELKNATIFGASSFILTTDNLCLLDAATRPDSNRVDFKYGPIKQLVKDKVLIDIPMSEEVIESGIMMNGIASYNYYHWLLEFIPRLDLINKLKKYINVPILLDQACHEIPQLEESLKYFKKTNQKVIFLEPNKKYIVKNLVVPSYTSWTVINLKKEIELKETDSILSTQTLHFLRKKLLQIKLINNKSYKNIYISRASGRSRKFNEKEIRQVFIDRGFEIIYPEELTFLEQVEIFSKADIIAGATGAGLTNIVFAPKSATILCMVSQPMNFSGFSNIAGLNKQKIIFLVGKPNKKNSHPYYQSDFTIKPDVVAQAVDSVILSKK